MTRVNKHYKHVHAPHGDQLRAYSWLKKLNTYQFKRNKDTCFSIKEDKKYYVYFLCNKFGFKT